MSRSAVIFTGSIPADLDEQVKADLADRVATGRPAGRSALIQEALRAYFERTRPARPAVRITGGMDLIVPAGADRMRSYAYQLHVLAVLWAEPDRVRVVGIQSNLDGSPRRAGSINSVLDPHRVITEPADPAPAAAAEAFPPTMPGSDGDDPQYPYRVVTPGRPDSYWATPKEAARTLADFQGAMYMWQPSEGHWHLVGQYSVTEPGGR